MKTRKNTSRIAGILAADTGAGSNELKMGGATINLGYRF